MKKIIAVVLVVIMMMSVGAVYASDNEMILTTNVPSASYVLNIPEDMDVPFGVETVNIGVVTVSESSGFAIGKNLNVVVEYDDFSCEGVSTTIPISLQLFSEDEHAQVSTHKKIQSGENMTFKGMEDGTVEAKAYIDSISYGNYGYGAYADHINLITKNADWGMALAGEYTTTITFKAEVVV